MKARIIILFIFQLGSFLSFGQISGTVFRDFNANGIKDVSATYNDVGQGGVTVKAYNAAGTEVGTTTSAANGTYSFTGLTLPLRIEFTTALIEDFPGAAGSGNQSSVQFYSSTSTTANYGINYPANYCQANPDLVTSCYVNGRPSGAGNEVIVKHPYSATGQTSQNSYLAQADQTGATWGLAYDKERQLIYTSAFVKRHTALIDNDGDGKEDIGAIYSMTSSGTPTLWVDLSTLGIDFGLAGYPTIAARGLPLVKTTGSVDAAIFDLVGKVGIGDIDISDDNSQLFVMNLFDKKVYTIDIATKTMVGSGVLVPDACTGGASRPFALKYHRGKLYAGAICDAETSQLKPDLQANLYRLDGGTFTNILSFPLNYPKGGAFQNQATSWNPWKNSFYPVFNWGAPLNADYPMWPQPIFSDIEFDVNEGIILSFVDRLGHQTGSQNRGTNPADVKLYSGVTGGDMLRAALVSGTYTIENNASTGGVTTAGANNNQGPGGGEFYFQELYGNHNETVQGGIALLAGSGDVAVISMDPFAIYSSGVFYMNNVTGAKTRAYEIVPSNQTPSTFGKANGLGDLELLCNVAPIEIGNRVWADTDSDGIQDAGEVSISGVTVELVKEGTVIATATTDANGNYYFSSGAGTNTASAIYSITQLMPNMAYVVRIPNVQGGSKQAALGTKNLTLANVGGSGQPDVRDSDGTLVGNNAEVTVLTTDIPVVGANNHTFDFGFGPATITSITCPGPYGGTGAVGDPAQWVVIGDPGNPADGPSYTTMVNGSPVVHNSANQIGYGSVGYEYSIADGFVTIKDYLRFLNAVDPTNSLNFEGGLATAGLIQYTAGVWSAGSFYCQTLSASDVEKVAVTRISLNQKARYANWVATGSVNTGAYTFASSDGNANITGIDNTFTGVRLLTENEYYKAAFWDQANSTYNLYGTTGLDGNGLPIVSGIGAGGIQTNPLGVVYTLSSPDPNICWPQVQSGQGGRSAYGVSNMAGGFHNSMIPSSPSFPIINDILRPDNLASTEAGQRSSYRNDFTLANAFYPSPSFQLAKTGNACICEVIVVNADPTPCNSTNNTYNLTGCLTFPTAPASGTLTISVPGATSIVMNPPFMSPIDYSFSGLTADGATKTVTATFSAFTGCTGTKDYTAPASCGQSCTLSATCAPTPQSSCTPANGGVAVNVTGAQGNLTYVWSSGETTVSISGKNAGTYTVTVTDDFLPNCTATCQAVITSTVVLPTAVCTPGANTNCTTPNGSASVSTNATSPTYLWSNNATTMMISNLNAGTYTVTVTEPSTGCTNTCQAVVTTTTTPPTANCTPVANTNCASPNGSASVSTNATSPTYLWSNNATTMMISNLNAGTYTVTVTDPSSGCTNTCQAVVTTSTTPPTLSVNIATQNTSCTTPNGSISTTTNAANPTYVWSNGATTSGLTNLSAGTFTVTVTDGTTGCTNSGQAVITNPLSPTCSLTATAQPSCANLTGGSISAQGSGGQSPYSFAWSNGASGPSASGLAGGTYTVTVTDTGNCTSTCQVTLDTPMNCCNINAIIPQNLECLDNGTPALITDNRIRFSAQVTNTNASLTGYNVTINGGTTITPNTNVPYGITQFTLGAGTAGGGATFTVTVTDSATPGCTQTFQVVDPANCTPAIPECPPVKCGTATIQVNGN